MADEQKLEPVDEKAAAKPVRELNEREKEFSALMEKPISHVMHCPHCGSTNVKRHASNPRFVVLRHNEGCFHSLLTVFEEGSTKHAAWHKRHTEGAAPQV